MPRRNWSRRVEAAGAVHDLGLNLDTREVWLSSLSKDGIDEAGIGWDEAVRFVQNMRLLDSESDGPVLVHQVVSGGDWNYGMAVYDAIMSSRSRVCILCWGWARSMTSIIPQAADIRLAMPNCGVLLHYGLAGGETDQIGKIEEAKWEAKLNGVMLDIYTERCLRSTSWFHKKRWGRDRIRAYIDRQIKDRHDVYLTAAEAVDWGLMDAVCDRPVHDVLDDLKRGKL